MRPDIAYQNHKNRQATFRHQAESDRLVRSSKHHEEKTTPIRTVITQKVVSLMSRINAWRSAKSQTPIVHPTTPHQADAL